MISAEAARWLDGRVNDEGLQVHLERVGDDTWRVNSELGEDRGTALFPGWKIAQLAVMFGLKDELPKPKKWADRRAQWVSLCNGGRVPMYPDACKELKQVEGRTHVWMYEPTITDGGIALTDRTGSRPEVGRIVGGPDDGMIVAVRPYAGYWIPGPWGEIRVYGVKDDAEDVILMRWNNGWEPMHDWLVVDRDPLMFQPGMFKFQGTVRMAGPDASAKPGDRCAWARENATVLKGFVLRLEEWGSRTGSFFGPETVLVWDGCAPSWSK